MAENAAADAFAGLSQCLTGFGPMHIALALDSFDYREALVERVGACRVDQMLQLYGDLRAAGADDAAIAAKILDDPPDPHIAALARALMKLWYLGIWVQPFDHDSGNRVYKKAEPPGYEQGDPPSVLGVSAYANGLAWKAMQTHPTAISHDQFGSWEGPPPPLSEFTG